MIVLRPYQEAAKAAVYDHLRNRDDNPCVVIPTGGGKTPVIASICRDAVTMWGGRVLILAHVKELLEQSAQKLSAVCPEVEFGVYSAGLKRRDTQQPIIVAGIQSVYKRAKELDAFDLVIVDEAHMIPLDGEGMYRKFLDEAAQVCSHLRVIGMTATPYRMKDGLICRDDHFLNHVCYEVGVLDLIRDKYLTSLSTKSGKEVADTRGLHVRAGEFIPEEVEQLMNTDALVNSTCGEVVERTRDRSSVLIFCASVAHGMHVTKKLSESHGVKCGFVCGNTPSHERDEILGQFREGHLKYLCNVNVLTTGFDAPRIDCVAMLRPTLSPGLYYQMVGRGFRVHPDKPDCLVLDFAGNVMRHGPVDRMNIERRDGKKGQNEAVVKVCPECQSIINAGYGSCPDCGYAFPPPEQSFHDNKATEAGILSDQVSDTEYEVHDVLWAVHRKRDAPENAPKSMRVSYVIGMNPQCEFICFEHTGYARKKAEMWWKTRSPDPVPDTAQQAVELAEAGALAITHRITVRDTPGEKYSRIVSYKLGEKQDPTPLWNDADTEDVPF